MKCDKTIQHTDDKDPDWNSSVLGDPSISVDAVDSGKGPNGVGHII